MLSLVLLLGSGLLCGGGFYVIVKVIMLFYIIVNIVNGVFYSINFFIR